jgi:hypothetical protein
VQDVVLGDGTELVSRLFTLQDEASRLAVVKVDSRDPTLFDLHETPPWQAR